MLLRITGTLEDAHVYNDATGDELLGVKELKIRCTRDKLFREVEITLDGAVIDLSVDSDRIDAVLYEDGKYAKSRLKDVARLPWRKRERVTAGD